MTRILPIALMLLTTLSPAFSGEVVVRGGEHPEFTRVVMEFEELPAWQSEHAGRSHQITFSDNSLSYDLSNAFRLIGRERVGDIRLIEGGLEFDISCDCSFSVSRVAANAIAAEVRPRTYSSPLRMHEISQMASPIIDDSETPIPDVAMPKRVAKPTMSKSPSHETLFDPASVLHPEKRQISLDFDLQPSRSVAIELLGRQLSRAVAQGLVDADPDFVERPSLLRPGGTQTEDRSNLSISTGIDRALNPNLDDVPPTATGAICRPNSQVDVNSWGDTSDTLALGTFRAASIAEDGTIDESGALKLAKFYIAMGFGAEAKAIAVHLRERDRELLTALGDILDNGFSNAPLFDGQVHCNGIIAFWAALAQPKNTQLPENTDQILSTFSSLAPHLRSHLGPILSETLRNAGRNEAARNVVNAMTRGGDITNKSALATARLDLESSLADEARDTLRDLSVGTDVTAAEALLELLQDAEDRGMAPNPAWVIDDVPSLVRAVEGTEVAAELNVAGLRGKIKLGMFDVFRKNLVEEGPGLNQSSRIELAKLALAEAVVIASPEDFLKTELGLSRMIDRKELPKKVRLDISGRLLELGLPKRALDYLSKNPTDADEIELKALIYIEKKDPASAIALLNASGKNANQLDLLANAYQKNGDGQRAIFTFTSAENENAALASALRTGAWDWVSSNGRGEVSRSVRGLSGSLDIPETNGELIQSSRNLRNQARALLNLTTPTSFEENFTN